LKPWSRPKKVLEQGDQTILKITQYFKKLPNQFASQNFYIKAQFESPKQLHQITFERAYLSENVIHLVN